MRFTAVTSDFEHGDCPYCKSQAFKYRDSDTWMFLCHSCQRNLIFEKAEEHARRNNAGSVSSGTSVSVAINYDSILSNCEVLNSLPDSHIAVSFIRSRGIDDRILDDLFYVQDARSIATAGSAKTSRSHKIVIPLRDEDKKLFGVQLRALDKDDAPKYQTILFRDQDKLFGLDRINTNSDIVFVEGPLDSIFLKNSLAMCGSSMDLTKYKTHGIIALDNEPRNLQIVSKMKKFIEDGFRIVIWPDHVKEKDINDMVLAGYDPEAIIQQNVYSGLTGKIKLNSWKKV